MKSLIALLFVSSSALAYSSDNFTDEATVIDVQPNYRSREVCEEPRHSRRSDEDEPMISERSGTILGAVVGGLAGRAVGSEVGNDNAKRNGAIVGAIAGASVGNDLSSDRRGVRQGRAECWTKREIVNYMIRYRYAEREFEATTRDEYHIGELIRVVVSVQIAE